MNGSHGRRLDSLERHAEAAILALPPREWIARGFVRFEALPADERAELLALLELAFTDQGEIDPTRLTPEQRARAHALAMRSERR